MFLLRRLRNAGASFRRESRKKDISRTDSETSSEEESDDEVGDLPEINDSKYMAKKQRHSVSAEVYGEWNKRTAFEPPVHPKTEDQKVRIKKAISQGFMFSALSPNDLTTVLNAFQERNVKKGETVITQGEEGDFLFLIEDGEFDVFKILPGETSARHMCVMGVGAAVGELALLYAVPRAASVTAKSDSTIWMLDRESFNHIVKDAAFRRRERHEAFLAEVELLKEMDPYERSQIADALRSTSYAVGEDIIVEGDTGNSFFIIESGEACALKFGKPVMWYKRGDYFGELALLKDQPRAATVRAKTALDVVWLDRRSFHRLCGPLDTILKRNASNYKKLQSMLSEMPPSSALGSGRSSQENLPAAVGIKLDKSLVPQPKPTPSIEPVAEEPKSPKCADDGKVEEPSQTTTIEHTSEANTSDLIVGGTQTTEAAACEVSKSTATETAPAAAEVGAPPQTAAPTEPPAAAPAGQTEETSAAAGDGETSGPSADGGAELLANAAAPEPVADAAAPSTSEADAADEDLPPPSVTITQSV